MEIELTLPQPVKQAMHASATATATWRLLTRARSETNPLQQFFRQDILPHQGKTCANSGQQCSAKRR